MGKEIGQRIAAARQRKGWTQLQLAARSSASPSSIQRWERGYLPRMRKLVELCNLLDLRIDELVPRDETGTLIADAGPTYVEVMTELAAVRAELADLAQLIRDREALDPPQNLLRWLQANLEDNPQALPDVVEDPPQAAAAP